MKKIRIKKTVVSSVLAASMLVGCGADGDGFLGKEEREPIEVEYEEFTNFTATSEFDKALMDFVESQGYEDENYMVSPTSFRAAMALCIAGADTETKEELIRAMGFESMEEVNAWYGSVLDISESFDDIIKEDKKNFKKNREYYSDDAVAPDGALVILNSIWNNTDKNGKFSSDYLNYVESYYSAEAHDVKAKDITDKVNSYVNDGTRGLIPYVSSDLSKASSVLVNTIYLKSAWLNSFNAYATKEGTFTTSKGEQVTKDFMGQQERFKFYEDEKGKLVVLPLSGGLYAIAVLGDIDDINAALDKAEYQEVYVKLPKFDVETDMSNGEFVEFLKTRGAELAFDDDADFSVMCPDTSWQVSGIIQKTNVKIDEEGLEAAAATAIMMEATAAQDEEEPKEFIADEPFKFFICGGYNSREVLFCGHIVE